MVNLPAARCSSPRSKPALERWWRLVSLLPLPIDTYPHRHVKATTVMGVVNGQKIGRESKKRRGGHLVGGAKNAKDILGFLLHRRVG
jgi:hypothetical protein